MYVSTGCLYALLLLTATARNYYEVLEVPEDATSAEIKKQYRRLALQYHPDKSSAPEAEARFIEVTQAYEVLATPATRAEYDRNGHAVDERGGGRGFARGGFGDPRRTFEDAFGDVWSTWQPGQSVVGSFVRGGKRVTITIHPDGSSDETEEQVRDTRGSYSRISRSGPGGMQQHTSVHIEVGSVGELLAAAVLPSFLPAVVVSALSSVLNLLCCGLTLWCCCGPRRSSTRQRATKVE